MTTHEKFRFHCGISKFGEYYFSGNSGMCLLMSEDFYIPVAHTVSARHRGQHRHYQFIITYPTYNNTFAEDYKNTVTNAFNFQFCVSKGFGRDERHTSCDCGFTVIFHE
jgi:hypothetical protein